MFYSWLSRLKLKKMLVGIANRGDPDQTASVLGLCCLSRPLVKNA